tara:strand:+ start:775 stop:987 length:213 start_codon:yes stop_codon:yes gene_type:complete
LILGEVVEDLFSEEFWMTTRKVGAVLIVMQLVLFLLTDLLLLNQIYTARPKTKIKKCSIFLFFFVFLKIY